MRKELRNESVNRNCSGNHNGLRLHISVAFTQFISAKVVTGVPLIAEDAIDVHLEVVALLLALLFLRLAPLIHMEPLFRGCTCAVHLCFIALARMQDNNCVKNRVDVVHILQY